MPALKEKIKSELAKKTRALSTQGQEYRDLKVRPKYAVFLGMGETEVDPEKLNGKFNPQFLGKDVTAIPTSKGIPKDVTDMLEHLKSGKKRSLNSYAVFDKHLNDPEFLKKHPVIIAHSYGSTGLNDWMLRNPDKVKEIKKKYKTKFISAGAPFSRGVKGFGKTPQVALDHNYAMKGDIITRVPGASPSVTEWAENTFKPLLPPSIVEHVPDIPARKTKKPLSKAVKNLPQTVLPRPKFLGVEGLAHHNMRAYLEQIRKKVHHPLPRAKLVFRKKGMPKIKNLNPLKVYPLRSRNKKATRVGKNLLKRLIGRIIDPI
jgi:hypothetical protein